MLAPPLLAGAVKGIDAVPEELEVGVPIVGAPGTVAGVAGFDADEALDTPAPLFAVTVNV
jgi:hypothetical protein